MRRRALDSSRNGRRAADGLLAERGVERLRAAGRRNHKRIRRHSERPSCLGECDRSAGWARRRRHVRHPHRL